MTNEVWLGITPIVGIRWWIVQNGSLYGIGNFSVLMSNGRICLGPRWHPGKPLKAGCLSLQQSWHVFSSLMPFPRHKLYHSLHKGLDAPQRDCKCGIYATKSTAFRPDYANTWSPWCTGAPIIQGEVSLWGSIIEYELGWRAQYAQVKAFHEETSCINRDRLYEMATIYHVPVLSARDIPS